MSPSEVSLLSSYARGIERSVVFAAQCLRQVTGRQQVTVVAKIRYTISTSTPTNHAERPLLVTSDAVMRGNEHHDHRARPELEVHRVGPMT